MTPSVQTKLRAPVINWENGLIPACDSEANFPAASTVFEGEGGGDGRGFGGFMFLVHARPTQQPIGFLAPLATAL